MAELPYPGRIVTYNNRDWSELYYNLRKAEKHWGMVVKVLRQKGAHVKSQAML